MNKVKLKPLFITILSAVMLFGILSGCKTEDEPDNELNGTDNGHETDELEFNYMQGEFYSLEEAYESGLITKENLTEIAHYQNNSIKYPEEINVDIENKIKNDAAYYYRHIEHPIAAAKPEGFKILKYYGEYNQCFVFLLVSKYYMHSATVTEIEIGEVNFVFWDSNIARVWKES